MGTYVAIVVLWLVQFLNIYISQGGPIIMTRIEYDGIFDDSFIANFPDNPLSK